MGVFVQWRSKSTEIIDGKALSIKAQNWHLVHFQAYAKTKQKIPDSKSLYLFVTKHALDVEQNRKNS